MISPPQSPTFIRSVSMLGELHTEDQHPALSPKRFFAQHEHDLELKRRHVVHPDAQPLRRTPLALLPASDLENRRKRSTGPASHWHSFVTPSSASDLRVLLLGQPVYADYCAIQQSGTPSCAWPPPIPTAGSSGGPGGSSHDSADKTKSSRATSLESPTLTRHAPDFFQTEPTTTMTEPIRTTGWKSENVVHPIRLRTHSMPTVRRPPEELWQSDSGPAKAIYGPVEAADSSACSTPPGLPPPLLSSRRSSSGSDLLSHGSLSLSLAPGSQPLRASEHTKSVSPIGAERSRAVSTTLPKSLTRHFPVTQSNDPSHSPLCSSLLSPRLQAKWKNDVYLLDTTSLEKVQAVAGLTSLSKEDLERLLRHAVRNKYAPKIISPLNPLRSATSAFDLSTDPEYQLRMPSQSNIPSLRYSKCPSRRTRTLCDGHQSFDWDTTCMHCQECQQDTIGKRLLAFRYHQHRSHPVQRGMHTPVVNDDRTALAHHIREAFVYEVDEEEKSLWDEVAAVIGAGPQPFPRVGAPCAATAHRRAVDDGSDDGAHDDYLEIPDEDLLANESATLFRDVTVY